MGPARNEDEAVGLTLEQVAAARKRDARHTGELAATLDEFRTALADLVAFHHPDSLRDQRDDPRLAADAAAAWDRAAKLVE
jgi:hypothetical protein